MIAIRKGLDFMFTRRELKILDDIMPETIKRKEEDQRQLETADVSPEAETNGEVPNPLLPLLDWLLTVT